METKDVRNNGVTDREAGMRLKIYYTHLAAYECLSPGHKNVTPLQYAIPGARLLLPFCFQR